MSDRPTNQSIDVLENKLLLFRDIVENGRMTDAAVRQWAEDICFELIVEKRRHLGFVDGGVKLLYLGWILEIGLLVNTLVQFA